MLIVGAKGMAKDLIAVLELNNQLEDLVFFDDINLDGPDLLFNEFPILKSIQAAENHFKNAKDKRFTLGVGFPEARYKLFHKFVALGAVPYALMASDTNIGSYDMHVGEGVTISFHCDISNSVKIGKGSFLNAKTVVGHDSEIGEFCALGASVNIGGHVAIGDFTLIGTGAILYPKIKIGENVSIAAGSVVRKSVPDNVIVHGNPAKIIGKKKSFDKSI